MPKFLRIPNYGLIPLKDLIKIDNGSVFVTVYYKNDQGKKTSLTIRDEKAKKELRKMLNGKKHNLVINL